MKITSTLGAAALGVGGVVLGGVLATSLSATAATSDTGTSSTGSYGAQGGAPDGARGPSVDTPVTGDEATKVVKAVEAKYGDVDVTSVRKDPDGSYDAIGTQGGSSVMADVSTDLKTITLNTGFGGDHGGPGGEAPAA